MAPKPRELFRRPIRRGLTDAELAAFSPRWRPLSEARRTGYNGDPPPGDVQPEEDSLSPTGPAAP